MKKIKQQRIKRKTLDWKNRIIKKMIKTKANRKMLANLERKILMIKKG